MKLHPHFRRARFFVHVRIDVGDASAKLAIGQIIEFHRRLLAELEVSQILFVNLRLHPDQSHIGQPVDLHARVHHLAFHNHFLDHEPVLGRDDAQRFARLPGSIQLGDLPVGNVKESQLRLRRGFERVAARAGLVCGIGRQEIFDLRAVKFRRINLEQWIAPHHQLARGVHVKLLDPALHFRRHIRQRRLVVINGADGADGPAQGPARHRRRPNSHVLGGHGIDLDGGGLCCSGFFRINGHHVHPHAVLAGSLPDFTRHHGGLVGFDFAFAGHSRSRRRSTLLADGGEFHAADGAISGMILDHLRMHAAGVEGLFLRGAVGRGGGLAPATPIQQQRCTACDRQQGQGEQDRQDSVFMSSFHFSICLSGIVSSVSSVSSVGA